MSDSRLRPVVAAVLLAAGALLAGPVTAARADGSCTKSITNSGHTAVVHCQGYLNSGRFRVEADACLTRCTTVGGNWAAYNNGTSTANAGSGYVSNLRIVDGGPMG